MLLLVVLVGAAGAIAALLLDLARGQEAEGNFDRWVGVPRGGSPSWPRIWAVSVAAIGAFALALLIVALVADGPHRDGPEFLAFLTALVVVVLLLRVWRREFLFLMDRHDDDFPGRFDKLIWSVLMIALPPIGLWFFRTYRLAHWPEPRRHAKPARSAAAADLS